MASCLTVVHLSALNLFILFPVAVKQQHNARSVIRNIYLFLPFTLLKQRLGFHLRKPPSGLPDFLCIGAQKAGTTWLFEQLRHHPDVQLADIKEVHYFDWYFYRPLRWYLKRFAGSVGKKRGEVTPGYSVIETGRIRFIKRIMPEVKLIFLLRDPRERAWSAARFHFGTVLGKSLDSISVSDYLHYFSQKWVKERGDYLAIWSRWSSVFAQEQLLVVFNEDISENPAEVLKEICSFIGVQHAERSASLFDRPNKSQEKQMPEEIRKYLDEMYIPEIEKMKSVFGDRVSRWIR